MPSLMDSLFSIFDDDLETEEVTLDTIRDFIESELKIIDKDTHRVVPFKFNAIQEVYWKNRTDNDYILKYRKGGFSTLRMAEGFARAVLIPNQQIVFIAHRKESTELIFQAMHLFYKNLSEAWKEKINGGKKSAQVQNKNEIRFSANDSQIIAITGASPDAMRGLTPTYCHMSEIAFWKKEWVDETISSILGSMPPGSIACMESTPSGAGSWAYDEWHRAVAHDSRFYPHFYAWWDDPTNTLHDVEWEDIEDPNEDELKLIHAYNLTAGQIAWRRAKRREQRGKFKREYPEDSEDCWARGGSTVFDMDKVVDAYGGIAPQDENPPGLTIFKEPQQGHSYVIGVDPAGNSEDGDFSAMIGIDEMTGEEVFEYYDRIPIHDFSERAIQLGMRYGGACLSVERNNHGAAVLQYMTLIHPYNGYLFADDDNKLGLLTTQKSKALMISVLDRFFWDGDMRLRGRTLFRQLSSYVYDDNKKAAASGNGKDDLVSALLCASYAWAQNHPRSMEELPPPPQKLLAPPPQTVRTEDAMEFSLRQFQFMTGVGGSPRKKGCSDCGSKTSVLVNGAWVCEGCGGRVSNYAII